MTAAKSIEPISITDLGDVVTTQEYARLLRVSPKTLTDRWRRHDPSVVQPVNPTAKKGYRFNRHQIMRKLRAR